MQKDAAAQPEGVPTPIHLRIGTFDLARGASPDITPDLRMEALTGEHGYYIVPFAGPTLAAPLDGSTGVAATRTSPGAR